MMRGNFDSLTLEKDEIVQMTGKHDHSLNEELWIGDDDFWITVEVEVGRERHQRAEVALPVDL